MSYLKTKTGTVVAGASLTALLFLRKIHMNKTAVAYKNLRAFLIMIQYSEGVLMESQ